MFFLDAHSKTFLFIHKTYIGKFFEISRIEKIFDTGEQFYVAVLQTMSGQLMSDIGGRAPEVMCDKQASGITQADFRFFMFFDFFNHIIAGYFFLFADFL